MAITPHYTIVETDLYYILIFVLILFAHDRFGHQRMLKVIKYIMKQKADIPLDANILDVGCGNGLFVHHMVFLNNNNIHSLLIG